jgi:hypothetical protein
MLWVPAKGPLLYEHNLGTVGAATIGTSVTTGASAATKGTPVQLIASTAFDAYMIQITASEYGSPATTARGCLDILVGAATEEVLIANLLMGFCGGIGGVDPGMPKTWIFPLYIPAGTRIAVQAAGDRTATALRVGVQLWGGNGYPPFRVGQKVTTYGIGTVPAGTAITPGASAAEGAWTQVVAATTSEHFCIVPSAQPPTGDTTLTTSGVAMDIGVGAATEEVIAGGGREQSYFYTLTASETAGGPINPWPCFADIPSGQRLAARLSRSSAADTVATWDVALHGVS